MGIVLGIDVGGTFTDFIEIGGTDGARVVKVPLVPASPGEGVHAPGLTQLAGGAAAWRAYLSGVELIVHGTTITTNAMLTRRYAKTGYRHHQGLSRHSEFAPRIEAQRLHRQGSAARAYRAATSGPHRR